MQHQRYLYIIIMDFERLYGMHCRQPVGCTTILIIQQLYDKDTSAFCIPGIIGDLYRTNFGVRNGCLQSSTLFIFFLSWIMSDALDDHEEGVCIADEKLQTYALHTTFIDCQEKNKHPIPVIHLIWDGGQCWKKNQKTSRIMINNPEGILGNKEVSEQHVRTVTAFYFVSRRLQSWSTFKNCANSSYKIVWFQCLTNW